MEALTHEDNQVRELDIVLSFSLAAKKVLLKALNHSNNKVVKFQ